jgi:hypothetical protein
LLNKFMKTIVTCFFMQLFLLTSSGLYAQVGIGTTVPDTSSILDVSSNSKGFLMPRLTTAERDAIILPAAGLMIYNSTLNDGQLNTGTPSVPSWIGIKGPDGSMIDSVTKGDIISTTSTTNLLVPGMTISPQTGTYLVLFNAQHNVAGNLSFSSNQGVIDAASLYDELMAFPGGQFHGLTFGSGETLSPGVYDVSGAPSIAGTLTLNGGGDPDAVFIIRGSGAFTTGVGATVVLTGNASPENIFWVSGEAMSTAANTTMKGTMLGGGLGAGAVSLGADSDLEGRLFTKLGAVTLAANVTLTAPTGSSPVNLGVLSTFAMWSSAGAVSDVATSTINGDVGTALGALTILGMHDSGIECPAGITVCNLITTTTTYCIYKNGAEVVNSSRTIKSLSSMVSLQAMVTLTAGDAIEVWSKVDVGEATLDNRTLSLINSGF